MKKVVIVFFLCWSFNATAQKFFTKQEEILIGKGKKWTVTRVKSKTPTLELGEELRFEVDKTYAINKNDYSVVTGKWFIDNRVLILNVDKPEFRTKVPTSLKIKTMRKDLIVLKHKPDKKQIIYLK